MMHDGSRTSSIDKAGCDYQVINFMPAEGFQSGKKTEPNLQYHGTGGDLSEPLDKQETTKYKVPSTHDLTPLRSLSNALPPPLNILSP